MLITILTENRVRRRSLLAEHGLSLWLEDGEDRVLFDVGQTGVYCHNAEQLGIDLNTAHAIVLSHGHYDHGGGLPCLSAKARWPRVFAHPDAFKPRFARSGDESRPPRHIGFPWDVSDLPELERHLVMNTSIMQIGENMYICTGVPQITDFEQPAADLLVETPEGLAADRMQDEQLLVRQSEHGLAVILGCSHPGVVNCLEYVRQLFPGQPIRWVIGGLHLEQADDEHLHQTIEYFRRLDARFAPLHCTGTRFTARLAAELGDQVLNCCTGETILIK